MKINRNQLHSPISWLWAASLRGGGILLFIGYMLVFIGAGYLTSLIQPEIEPIEEIQIDIRKRETPSILGIEIQRCKVHKWNSVERNECLNKAFGI